MDKRPETLQERKGYYIRSGIKIPNVFASQITSPASSGGSGNSLFSVTGAYNSVMGSLNRSSRKPFETLEQTPSVFLGRPMESSTPAVSFPGEPKFDKTNFANLSLHPKIGRSLNPSVAVKRKDSARSSTSTVGTGEVTVLEVPSRGDFYMDETQVYGTARPSKRSIMIGSLSFSGEQDGLHANANDDSSGDRASLETDSGRTKTNQVDQLGLAEPPYTGHVIEVDEFLDEVLSQSASISLADSTGATEDQSLPTDTFSKMAETLSKNQLAANQAQLHLLKRQEVMDELMRQHATSVSSQEFARTNKNLVTCINAMRDTT